VWRGRKLERYPLNLKNFVGSTPSNCAGSKQRILAPGASSFDAKDDFKRKDDSNISATTQRRCSNNYCLLSNASAEVREPSERFATRS